MEVEVEAIAGMVFTLILAAMIGGFILLIPLSKRLGLVLDAWLQEKQGLANPHEVAQLRKSIRALDEQLSELNERQQFMERLIEGRQTDAVPGAGAGSDAQR